MYLLPLVGIYVACRKIYFLPAFFYLQNLKRYIIAVRIIIPRLLFCPVQCVSSLALLTFFAARSRRSGTDYTVCDNLPALPRFAVLACPLAYLHVTRHAHQFAFVVFCQCVGLSAKRQDG
jgi:hypothetical protein